MNRKLVITAIIIALILIAGFYVNKSWNTSTESGATNSGSGQSANSIDSEISNSISDLDDSNSVGSDLGLDEDFDYNIG